MSSDKKTTSTANGHTQKVDTAKGAKSTSENSGQNLAFGLFGRRVAAPTEPAPKGSPSPVVDKAA